MDLSAFFNDHYSTLVVCAAAVSCYFVLTRERSRSAPGPSYVPFLGIIPGLVGDVTGPLVSKWAKEANSNIIGFKILGVKVAAVSSYDFIKETLIKRPDFSDREEVNLMRIMSPGHDGLLLSSGPIWRESRRVTLKRMRDLGMGSASGAQYINDEAEILIQTFEELNGEPFNPQPMVNRAVANVISGFAFGKRFDYNDPKFTEVLKSINEFARAGAGPIGTIILPFRLGRWIYRDLVCQMQTWWDTASNFINEQILEHEKTFDGTVNDLTDAFIDDVLNESGKFTTQQIRSNITDMFLAGADTSTVQLLWLLLHMAKYQNIQDKVHQEIHENIGNSVPSMQDKKNTPFTEATINEVMRTNILLFTGLPRTNNSEDFEIGGYKFKKGTPVIANYWSVHNDPEIFPESEKFDPGHFLTDDGKVTNLDRMVSFTLGRRSCAGESLARMEIYLFFVVLVQKFWIRAPEGVEVDLTPRVSAMWQPKDFQIRLIARKN